MTITERQKWLRVNRRTPCPVCSKTDWCLLSTDGSAAICARVQSDTRAGEAGWLHQLNGRPLPMPSPQPATDARQLRQAPIERRDAVYCTLLEALPLSERHQKHLVGRGLTETEVAGLQYRTLPSGDRRSIVCQLQEQGHKLGGIPGFHLHHGEVQLSSTPGILLPVRDSDGCIQALQVRADRPGDGGK